MSTDGVDLNRRHFLTVATTVVGGVGAVLTAVPFVSSMEPSARAKALGAPVEVDFSKLEAGAIMRVKWRGKPAWVVSRTPEMLKHLKAVPTGNLRDPDSKEDQQPSYCVNEYRSIKPEIFVVIGICTHLGCSPEYQPTAEPKPYAENWLGGFYCPCHGSRYDLAGRVFKGVPAPLNLVVPPYHFVNDTTVIVGEGKSKANGKGNA